MTESKRRRNDLIAFVSLGLVVAIFLVVLDGLHLKAFLYIALVIANVCILFYDTRLVYQVLVSKIVSKGYSQSNQKVNLNTPFILISAAFALITSIFVLYGIYQIAFIVFLAIVLIPTLITDTVNNLSSRG